MQQNTFESLKKRSLEEPFSKLLGIKPLEVTKGQAKVAMKTKENMQNIFGMVHGGAVFSLLDEAFQLACNSHGKVAVALQLSIYYLAPAKLGVELIAQAKEVSATRKTALYDALVFENNKEKRLIAKAQAMAYRKEPLNS